MARHNEKGRWGEDIAVEYLTSMGYAIVERNWRVGDYEVDIVAQKDGIMSFVEVKTRTNIELDPFEAVDSKKKRRLAVSANAYAEMYDVKHEIQFDIIGIAGTEGNYRLEYIPDAFEPPMKAF
ncbi:MAG: YraN family protein [Muribaculaceae bacterium]|nr:YraN family protein [Muribaculaceae bacterium]